MNGLPSELYLRCRNVLSKCAEFDGNTSLNAVFVTAELAPFKGGLQEAQNKNGRIDMCLNYLLPKQLADGRHVFPIFLETLRDRYQEGDMLRNELGSLAGDVSAVLSTSGKTVSISGNKHCTASPFDETAFIMSMADALLVCRTMSDKDSRKTAVSLLPDTVRRRIDHKNAAYDDVVEIIKACMAVEGGMQNLMEILRHFEKGAICMKDVETAMREYRS